MDLGYARVSTTHQDLECQLVALGEHGIPDERIYADKKTGATVDRPAFKKMLHYAREGDTTVATNLDRLGRNLRECLNVIYDLSERGIGVKTLRDPLPIDTTDTSGMAELSVAMLALFAHTPLVQATSLISARLLPGPHDRLRADRSGRRTRPRFRIPGRSRRPAATRLPGPGTARRTGAGRWYRAR
ncbi:recombinase family protein [Nocardia carnea]|uniref:recombinase family protein n=1 Tax=Nocardia carnea TaxID=37328 RepID=UPI00245432F8|nr:recombinase family protein [Nocardia carnea]